MKRMSVSRFGVESVSELGSGLGSRSRSRSGTGARPNAVCAWCHKEIEVTPRGRPRKFCSQSCRQRAYEQRNGVSGKAIPQDVVMLSAAKAETLWDGLYALRCAAEDVATATAEGADAQEIGELCEELVDLARKLEQLR